MLTCGLLRTNFSFDTAVSLVYVAEPSARIELATPSLPRKCTATVLRGRIGWWVGFSFRAGEGTRTLDNQLGRLELYQLSYTRSPFIYVALAVGSPSAVVVVSLASLRGRPGVNRGGRWIRTTVGAGPADLQSAPFGRSGIPPNICRG